MSEDFDFRAVAHLPKGECIHVHVKVKGVQVSLHDSTGQIAAGVWDAGKYVRYPHSQLLPLPPQLLDEIDKELRLRLRLQGLQARADPPRRSAIGYSDD
jgi:hypothetical protein